MGGRRIGCIRWPPLVARTRADRSCIGMHRPICSRVHDAPRESAQLLRAGPTPYLAVRHERRARTQAVLASAGTRATGMSASGVDENLESQVTLPACLGPTPRWTPPASKATAQVKRTSIASAGDQRCVAAAAPDSWALRSSGPGRGPPWSLAQCRARALPPSARRSTSSRWRWASPRRCAPSRRRARMVTASPLAPRTEPARSSFRLWSRRQARDHARTPRTRAPHRRDAHRALVWDRRSSRHFSVTSRCRSLAAWIPDWLVTPTSPVGFAANRRARRRGRRHHHDVGIITRKQLNPYEEARAVRAISEASDIAFYVKPGVI